jgi:type I restriction enzyme S subunit
MASDGWTLRSVDELKAPTNGAIAIGPFGSRMKSDCYVSSGVPVIRGNNIGDTREFVGEMVYITPELANQLGNAIVHADDLVFPHRGAIGQVGIVPRNNTERYALSSSLMKLTCDRRQVEPLFLFYFFRSADGQHELLKNASTVGTPGIGQPLSSLRSIKVSLPPLPEQKAIAHILGTLDDKIELNRRMNATLEAMARALFQSWFVDFDPVRAKLDGRPPAGLDDTTAALFPAHFQDSPLGPIPQGWEVCSLANKIELLSGGTPKTSEPDYWDGDIPWYSVKDAPSETDVWVVQTERHVTKLGIANSATQILPEGTTIISARGTVGKLALVGTPMAMNQSCYGVRGVKGYGNFFTYFALRQATNDLQQRTHGTVFDTITRQTFETLDWIFPPANLTTAFDHTVAPLLVQLRANLHQSRTLATLRDTLLPKLLSGELRVADINELAHSSSGTDG